ncbi:hypothetical protein [Bythopirellula polymerisocia]|uniref:hypothetical protein n=1 Tax=Bythopirellula polymerisocia TaxID=2528003 RepID=UPI0018D2B0FB|nr:hypothetical protein [Bythopirellula polymerisocia]
MSNLSYTTQTPEQVAAIDAGHGFAYAEDPQTHRKSSRAEEDLPAITDFIALDNFDAAINAPLLTSRTRQTRRG